MKTLFFRLIEEDKDSEKEPEMFTLSGKAEKFDDITDEIYLDGGVGDFDYWKFAPKLKENHNFQEIYRSLLNIAENMITDNYMKPEYKILVEIK